MSTFGTLIGSWVPGSGSWVLDPGPGTQDPVCGLAPIFFKKKRGENSNKVLTFKREGPSLNQERALFSCGKMTDSKGNTICVVAGGDYGTCILDTVEILDTSRIDEGWSWGILLFSTKF